MPLPALTASALPHDLFNQTCHDLPPAERLALANQLLEGKLTLRGAVAKGYASADDVDAWVDYWHAKELPCELRQLLDLSTWQYAEWMRNPKVLADFYANAAPAADATPAAPAPAMPEPKKFTSDDYIPMAYWAKDHWSTLAYMETVMVECAGFQVGRDPRMKSNRRNFRVMSEGCSSPRRPSTHGAAQAIVMQPQHATKLNDGQQIDNHDDWACVQDMAAEGLFQQSADEVEPGVTLTLSEKGNKVVSALREHRRSGGKLAEFRVPA